MRYALMAKAKTGERLNIFKDGRTYASIHAARRARLRMNYSIEPEIDIDEIPEPKPEVVLLRIVRSDSERGLLKFTEVHKNLMSASTRIEELKVDQYSPLVEYNMDTLEIRNDA